MIQQKLINSLSNSYNILADINCHTRCDVQIGHKICGKKRKERKGDILIAFQLKEERFSNSDFSFKNGNHLVYQCLLAIPSSAKNERQPITSANKKLPQYFRRQKAGEAFLSSRILQTETVRELILFQQFRLQASALQFLSLHSFGKIGLYS